MACFDPRMERSGEIYPHGLQNYGYSQNLVPSRPGIIMCCLITSLQSSSGHRPGRGNRFHISQYEMQVFWRIFSFIGLA
jgi:hypothetical protein